VEQKPYHPVVLSILAERNAASVLDAPCGTGWLGRALQRDLPQIALDGVGLWEFPAQDGGYQQVIEHDLDTPLPELDHSYDAVACCEAIHLVTNPGVVLDSFKRSLRPGGTLIITTPNILYTRSRLQFFLRGFHSGFSPAIGKQRGDYITYFPFTFPTLHLLLTHYGYGNITLHDVIEPKPKRAVEHLMAIPGRLYYRSRRLHSKTPQESRYWEQTGSRQSVHGRWLVVSATA
jgi:SAM-dependent methyltransferase